MAALRKGQRLERLRRAERLAEAGSEPFLASAGSVLGQRGRQREQVIVIGGGAVGQRGHELVEQEGRV